MHEAVTWAHEDWNWRGSDSDRKHDMARRALAAAPEDPIVLWRCLDHWGYFGMPVAEGWSSAGPKRAEGIPLLASVLERAETSLLRPDRPDTVAERCLTFFTKLQRALQIVGGEQPSSPALAKASQLLDELFELTDLPELGDEQKHYDHQLATWTSVRRRAWQALEIGPPYPEWMREKLSSCAIYTRWVWGWPLAPLTRDPAFRSFAAAQLAERTRSSSHPPPFTDADGNFLVLTPEELVERDAPTPDETEGRHLLALWLGIDQAQLGHHIKMLIHDADPPSPGRWPASAKGSLAGALERMLGLGFTPDPSVLVEAIEWRRPAIIRALVAAGVPVDRKAKAAAAKVKDKKVTAALSGEAATTPAQAASGAKLAAELRAAARTLDKSELSFIGSVFGRSNVDPVAIVDLVIGKEPSTPAEALAAGAGFVFDDYVLARALRAAGHAVDVKRKGGKVRQLVTSGDLVVDGALIDELGGGWVVVAGDLICDALITEADVIVGGDLRATTLVWGNYNDGSLVVNGTVKSPRIAMTDHTFECRGNENTEYLSDDNVETLFLPAMQDDGSLDRDRVIKAITSNKPYLVGVTPGKPKAPPKAKAKAKPKPAPKKPAKAKATKRKAKPKAKAASKTSSKQRR